MKEIKMKGSRVSEALAQIDALEDLSPKNKGCLRLLTEEMFSMCKELLNAQVVDFEIKRDQERYTLRVTTQTRVNEAAREQFLSMSSSGKNAANQGIKGMLGAVLEALSFANNDPTLSNACWTYGMSTPGGEYACMWSLSHYMDVAPAETVKSDWDGMEKSIIANFANDVSIGVRGDRLEMTVTKNF